MLNNLPLLTAMIIFLANLPLFLAFAASVLAFVAALTAAARPMCKTLLLCTKSDLTHSTLGLLEKEIRVETKNEDDKLQSNNVVANKKIAFIF